MKRKIFYFYIALIVITSQFIVSCGDGGNDFKGYIPVNEKPVYIWYESNPGPYYCMPEVFVVREGGDTIAASFDKKGFDGSDYVIYRDSYPLAEEKKIYVKVHGDHGYYTITKASLNLIK